jgi:hypothetical protein
MRKLSISGYHPPYQNPRTLGAKKRAETKSTSKRVRFEAKSAGAFSPDHVFGVVFRGRFET